MNCPIDNTQLTMSERSGIEIDYCPSCRGVWLDRGELDKLIEQSQNTQEFPSPRSELSHREDRGEYSRESKQHAPKKHKKESFLGDLFDF